LSLGGLLDQILNNIGTKHKIIGAQIRYVHHVAQRDNSKVIGEGWSGFFELEPVPLMPLT